MWIIMGPHMQLTLIIYTVLGKRRLIGE